MSGETVQQTLLLSHPVLPEGLWAVHVCREVQPLRFGGIPEVRRQTYLTWYAEAQP